MDEAPAGALVPFARVASEVATEAVEEHERKYHLQRPKRGPLKEIPFADVHLTDKECARAWELLQKEQVPAYQVAEIMCVPLLALERNLAEWMPRWHDLIWQLCHG